MIVNAFIDGLEYRTTPFEAQSALYSLLELWKEGRKDLIDLLFEAVIKYPTKVTPFVVTPVLDSLGKELVNFKWGFVTFIEASGAYALKPEVTIVLRCIIDQIAEIFSEDDLLINAPGLFTVYVAGAAEKADSSNLEGTAQDLSEVLLRKIARQPQREVSQGNSSARMMD